ncbi:MAG: amidase [Egibacteraceae bacterium]
MVPLDPSDVRQAAVRRDAWEPGLGAVVEWLDPPLEGAPRGPLAGVILGVKDLLAVAGVRRVCGAPDLTDPAPQSVHATAVARLLDAGATVVATLALHQFAYGLVTPQVGNPRAPGRVAGGSSGGSAAALATGMVQGSLGTDTGGSVRIPAACCGVVGLKTTRGLVPLTGVQPLAPSLDTVGPMARSVAEAGVLLDAIAGYDPADDHSVEAAPAPDPPPLAQLRLGVPTQVRAMRMDPDVRGVWEATLEMLAAAGARVTSVDVPALEGAATANGQVLGAEAALIHGDRLAAHADRFWPDVRARLERGRELRATDLAAAHGHAARLRAQVRTVFGDVDVLVTPTLPCVVPAVGADPVVVDGHAEAVVGVLTRFTNPWNLAGVPAGSVPAGVDAAGAPVGVQVVGPWFAEPVVLAVMAAIEDLRGGPWPIEPAPGLPRPPAAG